MSNKIFISFIALTIVSNVFGQIRPATNGSMPQPPAPLPPLPNNGSMPMTPPKVSNNRTHFVLTFPDGHAVSLPLYPINVFREMPMMGPGGPPPPPQNGTRPQQPPPQNGPFTYINNGTHIIMKTPDGRLEYYKLNLSAMLTRATSPQNFNDALDTFLKGQFNQQMENLITNSNLDEASKQKMRQLRDQLINDPVNFWANNWMDVVLLVNKLPKDFLAQLQKLILPSAN